MGDRTNFAARGLEHTFRWSQTSFTELDFTGCTRVKYCEIYQNVIKKINYIYYICNGVSMFNLSVCREQS